MVVEVIASDVDSGFNVELVYFLEFELVVKGFFIILFEIGEIRVKIFFDRE